MSTEKLNGPQINRRERRITIQLNDKHLVPSKFNYDHKFGRSSLAQANEVHLFESGDEVNGKVLLEISGGKPVVKINLALICLTQARSMIERRHSIIEVIFNKDVRIGEVNFERETFVEIDLIKQNGGGKLSDGKYEIPFKFFLPYDGLPSTMSSCYGFIKYTIQVFTFDEDRNENRGEKEIVVVSPETKLDLNIGETSEKVLHFAGIGTVNLKASLERRGYFGLETIPVKVSLENNTNLDICPRVTLYQTQVFILNQMHRAIDICLTDHPINGEMIESGQQAVQIINISLPQNLVVSLRSSLIIVKYFMHISLDIPHLHELYVNLPFVITTKRALKQQRQRSIKNRNPNNALISPAHLIIS